MRQCLTRSGAFLDEAIRPAIRAVAEDPAGSAESRDVGWKVPIGSSDNRRRRLCLLPATWLLNLHALTPVASRARTRAGETANTRSAEVPDMSGAQLAAQVRALHPSLPILLASGFAELEGAVETAWPRLRKPFSLGDLSAALAQVMPHEQ